VGHFALWICVKCRTDVRHLSRMAKETQFATHQNTDLHATFPTMQTQIEIKQGEYRSARSRMKRRSNDVNKRMMVRIQRHLTKVSLPSLMACRAS
jgi:hypothetical protein